MVEGTEQISATLKKNTVNRIIRLKQNGIVNGVSDYLQRACDFYEDNYGVHKKDVMVFVIYPWIIAMIFFICSSNLSNSITFKTILFYLNLLVFGLIIASIYWLYSRFKRENMEME